MACTRSREVKSWAKSLTKVAVAFFSLSLFIFPVNAADAFYTPQGMGISYNGSDDGWVMAYDWTSGAPNGLRVSFSVARPTFTIGKMVGVYIRADGYYSRDCGWWYRMGSADVDSIAFYYPNGTQIGTNLTGSTDATGIWRDDVALKLTKDMPMGTYKAHAQVTGNGTTVGDTGRYMKVYFDVGGDLVVTANTNGSSSNGIWYVNKGDTVNITGKILQPNGDEFNSSTITQGADTTVKLGVSLPDTSYLSYITTTSNGDFSFEVPMAQIGKYFIVVSANTTVGGAGGIRNTVSEGRNQTYILSQGEWPESSISYSPLVAILAAFVGLFVIQNKRGCAL
jgi:hypothetical protein